MTRPTVLSWLAGCIATATVLVGYDLLMREPVPCAEVIRTRIVVAGDHITTIHKK